MDAEVLANWMVRRGVLTPPGRARARRRQELYGGGFDTIVLELGLCDEPTVTSCLSQALGLDAAPRAWLDEPDPEARRHCDLSTARRLGAVPVAIVEERVSVVVRPGADLAALSAWASGRDLGVKSFIVPEVRFEALLGAIYGSVVPSRFATLLGRLMGPERARRWAEVYGPPSREVAAPPVDTVGPKPAAPTPTPAPEPEVAIYEDSRPIAVQPAAPARARAPQTASAAPVEMSVPALLAALGAVQDGRARQELLGQLRARLADPAVLALAAQWRARAAEAGPDAAAAMAALAAMKDRHAVPVLIERLGGGDPALADAAHAALLAITRRDFGRARWRWNSWWRERKHKHRVEWLIEALGAKTPELRLAAAQELETLGGVYVGYHFDLGKREREEARRRWMDWWESTGKAAFGALEPPEPGA
jgi:hypothetical protein